MYTLDDIREDYKWQRELERRNCTIKISQRDYLRISHRDWGLPTGTYVGRIWRWFDKDNKPRITEICYNSVEDIPVEDTCEDETDTEEKDFFKKK